MLTESKYFLPDLGWKPFFHSAFVPFAALGYQAGRVSAEHRGMYRAYTEAGEIWAAVAGKMRGQAHGRQDLPVVGDWVALSIHEQSRATIHAILPRLSKFSRQAAGEVTAEQIIAANIDTVFLVTALNRDFNLRRLERYLTLVWESGASPVIILSKADICADIADRLAEVETIACGVPVHVTSSLTGAGLGELGAYLGRGRTVALLGSSGAGKSTLANRLFGMDIMKVRAIRESDGRGRHTTTHRQLIVLPQGGLLIDTPGMRELRLWGTDDGLQTVFSDIEHYARQCRFSDCRHEAEPGCAVRRAIEDGELSQARYESYRKLQKELAYLSRRENRREYLEEKERWKKIRAAFRQRDRQ